MKFLFFFFGFIILMGCSEIVPKPNNLVTKQKMANLIAELALSEQLPITGQQYVPQNQTLYLLKKHQISPKDFNDSYRYYVATGKMQNILNEAENMLIENNPTSENYIKEHLKKTEESLKKTNTNQ